MNRKELVSALSFKAGMTKAEADRTVSAVIGIISTALERGDKVTLSGFGAFWVRNRAARIGRNPKTGRALDIKPSRAAVFRPSPAFKAVINRSTVDT
jgi:DNA-binding protein HU-beta